MVIFLNISIGQYVEVKHKEKIVCGTVKYKGHVNGESGEWIGIQLDYPIGKHNGTLRGRQYFKCPNNTGLFTHASNVRFRRITRRSRDAYRKVDKSWSDGEDLSSSTESIGRSNGCYSVGMDYVRKAKVAFDPVLTQRSEDFMQESRYPLKQSISRMKPAATMLKQPCFDTPYRSYPIYEDYSSVDPYISHASIPHYTMPHEVQKRQVKRGDWESFGLTKPRFMSV
uniref:tubulin-folding cofactor E-like n=1 Tax=Ciona intestinalis TaxID=7719 RepID=UPI000521485A|nr:tubulin-folding cofactor E-like [Ciona intestinalis]|eukprot:XP_009859104.1 tubulin-folding cofactor E-like [Ciona intestinalis]